MGYVLPSHQSEIGNTFVFVFFQILLCEICNKFVSNVIQREKSTNLYCYASLCEIGITLVPYVTKHEVGSNL